MDFLFYFFYGLFRRFDRDPTFTSILATFIVINLYLLAILKLFLKLGFVRSYPTFHNTYLYNKLYWYIPAAIVLCIVYSYFSNSRRGLIIKKFEEKNDFYSMGAVFLFVLIVSVPIFTVAYF